MTIPENVQKTISKNPLAVFLNLIKYTFIFVIVFLFFTIGQHFIPYVWMIVNPMHAAIGHDNLFLVELLANTPLKNAKKDALVDGCFSALESAVSHGKLDAVKILVNHGADLVGCHGPVVFQAAHLPDLLEYFLDELKIDPNFEDRQGASLIGVVTNIECKSYNGIFWKDDTRVIEPKRQGVYTTKQVITNHINSLELLLIRGANPNNTHGYYPPLGSAASHLCTDMVEMLLKYGANPNQRFGVDHKSVIEYIKNAKGFPWEFWKDEISIKEKEKILKLLEQYSH